MSATIKRFIALILTGINLRTLLNRPDDGASGLGAVVVAELAVQPADRPVHVLEPAVDLRVGPCALGELIKRRVDLVMRRLPVAPQTEPVAEVRLLGLATLLGLADASGSRGSAPWRKGM